MSYTLEDSAGPAGLTKGRAEAALAGETLANRYDVLELLGVGGMGAVYRARDRELDDIVALKVIRKELAAEPAMVERFRHEVKLARRVTHVNVARTFELGTVDGLMYCTMELVDGEALSARLQQRSKLQVGEAVAIACAVCDGLAAAHAANVIHRDIKPDNILLASDGRVVLADFGVAAAGVGAAGELSGTPAYMAPEQGRGESPHPAADVYAVGVVLAEMLSGRCPFGGDALAILDEKQRLEHVILTEVPPELAMVVGRATARDIDARIQTASALRRALEPWARGMTRMDTQPARIDADSPELTTVVVVAPSGKHERLYIAEAVHEQLLARLARTPRLRVWPRAAAVELEGAIHVTYALDDAFTATIGLPQGEAFTLRFPLSFAHVGVASDAIFETIEGEVARRAEHVDARSEAIELFLRARHHVQRDVTKMPEVLELLRQARELAPQEPRILAGTAIAYVRTAFFLPEFMPDALERARELAYAAVVAAPDLADAHIAVGHVELGLGNGVLAATHFRTAIRCAPHLAEAHEQLGRLLLEAGYLDDAVARLEDAIAIAPELRSARWEIARSYALEGKWQELDTFATELVRSVGSDRPLARARYAWWRRDLAELRRMRTRMTTGGLDRALHPGLLDAVFSVFLDDNGWANRRELLLSVAKIDHPNRRRLTFILQLIIEAAAASGDHDASFSLLWRAIDHGLFDRHWLENCPLFETLRSDPRYPEAHKRIRDRADAIHDALHGDNVALSETAIA